MTPRRPQPTNKRAGIAVGHRQPKRVGSKLDRHRPSARSEPGFASEFTGMWKPAGGRSPVTACPGPSVRRCRSATRVCGFLPSAGGGSRLCCSRRHTRPRPGATAIPWRRPGSVPVPWRVPRRSCVLVCTAGDAPRDGQPVALLRQRGPVPECATTTSICRIVRARRACARGSACSRRGSGPRRGGKRMDERCVRRPQRTVPICNIAVR